VPSGDQAFRADLISAGHLCVTHDVQNYQPRTDDLRNTNPGYETMPAPSAAGYRQTHGTIHCIQFLPVASRHPGVRFRIQIGEPAFVPFLLAACRRLSRFGVEMLASGALVRLGVLGGRGYAASPLRLEGSKNL
jgi:hypothetical protein